MTSHLSVALALASIAVAIASRVVPAFRARSGVRGPQRPARPASRDRVPVRAPARVRFRGRTDLAHPSRAPERVPRPVAGRVAAPGARAALGRVRTPQGRGAGARWAARADLGPLLVGHPHGACPAPKGRLVLGEPEPLGLARRRRLLAAEKAQSLAVVGPTQSGKTTSLAVPAILAWEGPVLAASVKTDLVRDTRAWRERCGTVWCFDPAGTTGLPQSSWSPVHAARTWPMARRVAADLTEVARSDQTSADGEFWYATAAKLLAPLFFAAAAGDRTIHDVVRWVDTQETEEVSDILHEVGVPEALQAARATWLRDTRQRSAVYTTAETVLEPFAEPELVVAGRSGPGAERGGGRGASGASGATPPYGVPAVRRGGPGTDQGHAAAGGGPQHEGAHELGRAPGGADEIDPDRLLAGANTLYVCAPAHDQRRLRAVFVALVQQVVHAAFARAARAGRPLDPPLLVVLDEAANIAPLKELDGLAATCAGHGVQLVTVWQDLAQVRARYGERAATVVNNHRAKLFLPGIADPGTLDFASHLAGDEERTAPSVTVGARGQRTVTTSAQVRRLLPPDTLRRLPAGRGVLLYGALSPARIRLRPWYEDPVLAARAEPDRA